MQKVRLILLLITILFFVSGCMPDFRVDLTYDRVVNAAGGSGEIYIAKPKDISSIDRLSSGEWILGTVRGAFGEKKFDIVTPTNVGDWIVDALTQELTFSGYHVNLVSALPQGASKGIDLTLLKLTVNHGGVWKLGAVSDVQFRVDIVDRGIKTKSFDVLATGDERTALVGVGVKNVGISLRKAMQIAMHHTVPEIIKTLER